MQWKVFHGVPVATAEVESNKVYSLVAIRENPDETDFEDLELRFDIDLSLTPKRTLNWSKIQVDDRGETVLGNELPPEQCPDPFYLNITNIGSGMRDSPTLGAFVGVAYLEQSLFGKLQPECFPHWPPEKFHIECLTSIAIQRTADDGSLGVTRYHGFVGSILEMTDDVITFGLEAPNARCTVPRDAVLENPPDVGFVTVDSLMTHPELKLGGVFIELGAALRAGLHRPKIPVGLAKP